MYCWLLLQIYACYLRHTFCGPASHLSVFTSAVTCPRSTRRSSCQRRWMMTSRRWRIWSSTILWVQQRQRQQLVCVWLDLTLFLCLCVTGDAEAPGLSAARQLSAPAVQRPMWGGGQVPAHLHPPEARPGSREVPRIRQRRGTLLPAQAVSGAVQHPSLCPERWAAHSLQVREESRNQ